MTNPDNSFASKLANAFSSFIEYLGENDDYQEERANIEFEKMMLAIREKKQDNESKRLISENKALRIYLKSIQKALYDSGILKDLSFTQKVQENIEYFVSLEDAPNFEVNIKKRQKEKRSKSRLKQISEREWDDLLR